MLVAFVAWATWYVVRHVGEFRILAQVPPWSVVLLLSLALGLVVCNGLYVKCMMAHFGHIMLGMEWLWLSVATTAVNYITPAGGGSAFRAMYLKSRYRFSIANFLSSLAATHLFYLSIQGVAGILGLAITRGGDRNVGRVLFALFLGMALVPAALLAWIPRMPAGDGRLRESLRRLTHGWFLLRGGGRVVLVLIGIQLAQALLSVLVTRVAFAAIHVNFSWGSALVCTATQSAALFVSLTPVGVVDAVTISLGGFLGYTTTEGLAEQILLRIVFWSAFLSMMPVALNRLNVRLEDARGATHP